MFSVVHKLQLSCRVVMFCASDNITVTLIILRITYVGFSFVNGPRHQPIIKSYWAPWGPMSRAYGPMGPWAQAPGPMRPWAHGPIGPWAHGPMGPWDPGPMGPWAPGPLEQ